MTGDAEDEILLETSRIRGSMEVRAISTMDGLEVSFTAPANAMQADIARLARQKLAYVRRKQQGGGNEKPDKPDGKGGLIA
jgi:predicted metal-dependent hydrolase